MASLEDIGLVNQDDDEELRAKAIEALASPKQVSPSDLDVSQAETSPVGSALLKKYLIDPRKQAEADDTYMRNQLLVGGLRNFLSPKSGEANLKVAENTPNPQDRLKSYADLLSKVQAASKGERESEYLNQEISPALRAHYDSLGIPLPEKATYGSLAATEKANKPIFDSLRDKNKLEQMKQILDYKAKNEIEREDRKPPTSEQFKAATFGQRLSDSEKIMNDLASSGFTGEGVDVAIINKLPDIIAGKVAENYDPRIIQLGQAQRNFVNAALRRESGSAISNSEFDSAKKQYFPQPGDSADVLAQKARNRAVVTEALMAEGGRASKTLSDKLGPSSTTVSPQTKKGKDGKTYRKGKDGLWHAD